MEDETQLRSNHPYTGTSYFYFGSLAIIVSWVMATVLTGCRFGNYTSPSTPPDPVSGYYDANPQTLKFCATHGATQCASANASQVPAFIADEITNPVALILQDASTGDAVFTAPSGGHTALPVWLKDDNVTLYYTNNTSASTLWRNSGCKTTTYLSENGSIVPGGGHAVSGSTRLTQGSITLQIQVTETFDGPACPSELQSMSNCYQDSTQCGDPDAGRNQQLQAKVQDFFESYIQAGVMAASDIPSVSNIAYEVHYQ
jgi:hypothetical protein